MAAARRRLADPVPDATPQSDAYVGLLAISLVAMLTGTVFLFMDYWAYEGKSPPQVAKYSPPAAPPPAGGGGGTSGP